MKKILSLLLALGLCFGLTGCSDEDTKPKENNTKDAENTLSCSFGFIINKNYTPYIN